MPNDNRRAIKEGHRGRPASAGFLHHVQGYGPNGVAVLVTVRRQQESIGSDIRHIFDRAAQVKDRRLSVGCSSAKA